MRTAISRIAVKKYDKAETVAHPKLVKAFDQVANQLQGNKKGYVIGRRLVFRSIVDGQAANDFFSIWKE